MDTVQMLNEDLEATRHPSDGGGKAWIVAPDASKGPVTVPVGSRQRFVIVYEAGPLGIAEGGAIRFIVSPFWNWSPPQIARHERLGYTTVETDAEGIELELSTPSYLDIRVRGRALVEGERVRIVYGDGTVRTDKTWTLSQLSPGP